MDQQVMMHCGIALGHVENGRELIFFQQIGALCHQIIVLEQGPAHWTSLVRFRKEPHGALLIRDIREREPYRLERPAVERGMRQILMPWRWLRFCVAPGTSMTCYSGEASLVSPRRSGLSIAPGRREAIMAANSGPCPGLW